MSFNIIKNRRGSLISKLNTELNKKTVSQESILSIIDGYEKNNLETISKLKKERLNETKRISGALKQTINAHGSITPKLIGSATKRIYGALLKDEKPKVKTNKIKLGVLTFISIVITISIVYFFTKN
jgi:hypothetical protein